MMSNGNPDSFRSYTCPIDGKVMENRYSGRDAFKADSSYCQTCDFEYIERGGGLDDLAVQAQRYVSGLVTDYRSLKSQKRVVLERIEREFDTKRSGLEEKMDKIKQCAQREFLGMVARVIYCDKV